MAKTGDWKKLKNVMKKFDKRIERNSTVALHRSAIQLESMIKERILDGKGMKPNHPFTIKMKRSSKPLIDNGDLLGSVSHHFIDRHTVAVGVNRRTRSGVNIAALHEREKGVRIKVTPKMRAWLHGHGLHLKPSTKELFIPGRPFMKPSYNDFRQKGITKKLFKKAIEKTVKGE